MANTSAIWQQAAHTTDQQKSITLNEKYLRVFWKQSQENGPLAEKWQDRKSKRTRQKKEKKKKQERRQEREIKLQPWDSRREGKHQTSPASLRGKHTRERKRQRQWHAHTPERKGETKTDKDAHNDQNMCKKCENTRKIKLFIQVSQQRMSVVMWIRFASLKGQELLKWK